MSKFTSLPPRARWFLYCSVVLGISFAVWYFAFRSSPQKFRYPQPAWAGTGYPQLIPVRTVAAEIKDLPVRMKAIGTVVPHNTIVVKSRVDGQLMRVHYSEGQAVEAGQLLAEVDPIPYRITLSEAEGKLVQNVARAKSANSDLARIQDLYTKRLVTEQELQLQQALAAERDGAVAVDQALVERARLQLAYTSITAPIAGRVGFRRVDVGNMVRQGDAEGLVLITQTRPISVRFTIPEVDLPAVIAPYRAGETLVVEAWDRNEKVVLATGVLKTVDNQIDASTGTLRLKAEFANADESLFPNQFVNVRLRVRTIEKAIVIPSVAVQFGSRGTYVYVVNAEKKAMIRDVVLGATDGPLQAVTKGLQAGDAVVLEGLDRLREGRGVVVANEPVTAAAP